MATTKIPGADLLRANPDEDRALGEIEWPAFVDVGGALLGLALTSTAVVAALFFRDPGAAVHAAGVALVVASSLPWVLSLATRGSALAPEARGTWRWRLCRAYLALVPLAVLNVAAALGAVDLGSDAVYEFVSFPVPLAVVAAVVSESRRTAALVALGGYLTVLVGFAAATRHSSEVDWTGLVAWHVALIIAVCAALAVRQGLLAMHRSRAVLAQQAIATERRRVARDVHDVVAHTLSVTMLHVTAARMAVGRGSLEGVAEALEEAERHGRASLADIRRTVRLLRADDSDPPVEAPQPDLGKVGELVDGYRAAGLAVELAVAGPTERVAAAAGLAVYRALQEALANAARHGSGPARVELRVGEDGDVALSVDNPVPGPDGDRSPGPGSGLLGMRERIAAAGGTLETGRQNGRWSVRARIPVAPSP